MSIGLLRFHERSADVRPPRLESSAVGRISTRLRCRSVRWIETRPTALEYIHQNPVERGYVSDPAH
jgi:hypothetical protein